MKTPVTCLGCLGLDETWPAHCKLGYVTKATRKGGDFRYSAIWPAEPCPNPKTAEELKTAVRKELVG